jgi:hypothetical protein
VRRTSETLIAPAATSASREHGSLTGPHEIVAGALLLDDRLRPRRDPELERLAGPAVAERALAVAATTGLELSAAPERLEVTKRRIAYEHDVAAPATVAAVWAALGHMGLPPEAQAAVAAGSGLNVYACSVLHWEDAGMASRRRA